MFINHMYKDEILYLEIDVNYDFGNFSSNNSSFINEIKEYIKKAKIDLKRKKVILTCSGVIIGSIILTNFNFLNIKDEIKYVPSFKDSISYVIENNEILNNNEIKIEEEKKEEVKIENNNKITITNTTNSNENISNNASKSENNVNNVTENTLNNADNSNNSVITQPSVSIITIHRSNGSVINISLEEYVIGVIAAEMPASFNIEALKAQSVLARTYALKSKSIGKTLTDTVSAQAYIDTNQMQNKWGASYNTYYNKIKNAVTSTNGEYLSYNGNYIEALYHSTSNGNTESSMDVFGNYYPYLVSVNSSYDTNASSYLRSNTYDINAINNILGTSLNNDSKIEILSKTSGNNINEISFDGIIFTGKQIREKLSLRSTDFDISINNNIVTITTRGYGHGVGMSQYGANGMANAGYNYKSILSHYYPGTTLKK